MKRILILIAILLNPLIAISQTASTYFPSNPGYIWYYERTVLDSNNNSIPGSETYRIDSFSVVQNYSGLLANYVPSKRNLLTVSQPGPYNDTSFFNFQGSNAFQYTDLTRGLDTITFLDTSGLLGFIASLNGWYNTYRFASNVGQEYTIFTKDTTLNIAGEVVPIRVSYTGRRLNDENVQTIQGNLSAKKFLLTATLYYLLSFPPLPPIPVEILSRDDTVWVSSGKWMIKEVVPSVEVDLTSFGIPVQFTVPGETYELTNGPVNIINYSSNVPVRYSLEQNYPNPFNPTTSIKFSLPESSIVSLRVVNIAGQEVANLIKGEQRAGTYEVVFDGANLTSGVYFYILEAKDYTQTRKMTLIK